MRARRPRRIFLGLTEVAGYYGNLAAGFRAHGIDADFIDLYGHRFGYTGATEYGIVRLTRTVAQRRVDARALTRPLWLAAEAALRVALLFWCLARYDVFILGFASSFLGLHALELRLMRALGKRTVSVLHGSDTRPPYIDGHVMADDRGRTTEECIRLTAEQKRRIAAIDRYADHVVVSHFWGHLHERPCVNWLLFGLPVTGTGFPQRRRSEDSGPIRVLHSPSHPAAKGSREVQATVERLRARGLDIELLMLTGRTHAEVLEQLAACDLVIDQLYSDTPSATFATEAAFMGVPAIVGSYATRLFEELLPVWALPGTVRCLPEDLEPTLEELVRSRALREQVGERAREFASTTWSPESVADRFIRLIHGDVPDEWLYDPADIRYCHGYGLPEQEVKRLIAAVVEAGGTAALQLDDKPALRDAFVRFAAEPVQRERAAC